ncbi:hypothetical protein OPT61_g3109 [Boeremia exigua]|uniref:Uncharacterized protein n=1 Tax=Boeremia exigua TaxID=749465 RepID=A0ACC2IJ81_9PLEO|nr:hypothetical protein OPT61_g3109 [Boeremia exigua]
MKLDRSAKPRPTSTGSAPSQSLFHTNLVARRVVKRGQHCVMDASTRLYARLGQIPESPDDPESLEDLIVCAFGAFERYYLCWKTKGGDYRQDGYDLPPALSEWLNPTDGTTRDWASLQVVFGRGEEYFASDQNGKLEFKEPEVKKTLEEGEKEKMDRQAVRRSRTVSFLRPLSQASSRSEVSDGEMLSRNRRTSSISSQRASRPPSLSYSTTGSEVSSSQLGEPHIQDPTVEAKSALSSEFTAATNGDMASKAVAPAHAAEPTNSDGQSTDVSALPQDIVPAPAHLDLLENHSNRTGITSIPEEQIEATSTYRDLSKECTCGCHEAPLSYAKRPTYVNASVQTDPTCASPRKPLRVDTHSASTWGGTKFKAVSRDVQTPDFDSSFCAAPFAMGRMTNYFGKPGYQLGDSLAGGYYIREETVYTYQEEFGDQPVA